jgi:hypothetical protein
MIASQNQLKTLIIGDNLAIGVLPASGVQVTPSNLPAGAVCLTDPSGLRVVASGLAAKTGKYVIVQSQGPSLPLIKSDVIDFSTAEINYKAHVSPKEQVTYIGYIGSGSSLLATAPATGLTKSLFGSVDVIDFNISGNRIIKKEFTYFATDVDTATTIATGLVKNMIDNVAKMGEPFYKAERVASTTSIAAITGSSTIVKVTKGSKVAEVYIAATATDSGALTASTASVTTGNVISFPSTSGTTFTFTASILGTGAGSHVIWIGETMYTVPDAGDDSANATAIAAAINAGTQAQASASTTTVTITYKDYAMYGTPMVMSTATDTSCTWANIAVTTTVGDAIPVKYVITNTTSSTATFLLDIPWQGETQYFMDGTTDTSNSGIATLASSAGVWGIKLTGKPKQYIPQVMRGFEKVRFTVGLGDAFLTTCPVTYSIAAAEGTGTPYQIQELERFSQMNQGNRYTSYNPPTQYIANALAYGLNFNTFSLSFRSEAKHGIINNSQFRQEILVAGVEGTNTQFSEATNGLWELLETLSGTTFTAWS